MVLARLRIPGTNRMAQNLREVIRTMAMPLCSTTDPGRMIPDAVNWIAILKTLKQGRGAL
jgi:hypothetical protein